MKKRLLLVLLLVAGAIQFAEAQIKLGLETGSVFTGYNDVRIPGNTGTKLSLNNELVGQPFFFYRINVGYTFNSRHNLSLLFAPLKTTYKGSVDRDIQFVNTLFAANTDLNATYKFNSYRITYRYDFIKRPSIEFGMGLTAKIRDAKIALASSTASDQKTNIGFVPIINFRLLWNCTDNLGVLLQGDALAAPQGRAEDVLLAVTWKASKEVGLYAGYRLLEGGSDSESVYGFASFNYIAIGATYAFDLSKRQSRK